MSRKLFPFYIVLSIFAASMMLYSQSDAPAESNASAEASKKEAPANAADAPAGPLGKTVKLVFKIKSEETNSVTLVCATRKYSFTQQYSGNEGTDSLIIDGQLHLIKDKADQLLLTYNFSQSWEGLEESGDTTGQGSAQVTFGKETMLMQNEGFGFYVEMTEVK